MRVIRGFVASVLVAAGLFLVPFANIGVWTRRELLSSAGFAHLSVQVLRVPEIRDTLAEQVADELVQGEPRLAAARTPITASARSVLASDSFEGVFRAA